MPTQRTAPGDRPARDFDYVTVGHVTADVLDRDGSPIHQPGGGAFYSALQAARLGLRTLIVTKGRPQELEALLEPYRGELDVRILPAEHTTTLATTGAGDDRRQRVLAWAGAMAEPVAIDTAILHLAAVARETPTRWHGQADFVGLTPQGLVRAWDADGAISLVSLDPAALPERYDAAVVSRAELAACRPLLGRPGERRVVVGQDDARAGAHGRARIVAVTAGSEPTEIHLPDGSLAHAETPTVADPREDLGAGDVFAAAFFVTLHAGRSPAEAAAYGNAAAAVRIAGVGPGAIGDGTAIDAALRR